MSPGRAPDPAALSRVLDLLAARDYAFVTPNRGTVGIHAGRPVDGPPTLRDVFGWNRRFEASDLEPEILAALREAGAVREDGDALCSRVRISTVDGRLHLHSGHHERHDQRVFLGPDTYRFVSLLRQELSPDERVRTLFDIGAGSGAGGLTAAHIYPEAQAFLGDINPEALAMAGANARHAGRQVELVEGPGLDAAPAALDLILANPPFIAGSSGQTYKDGGDLDGGRLSVDWALAATSRLASGGRFIMYTGSAIQAGGEDPILAEIRRGLPPDGFVIRHRELDPDIFSSELKRDAYAHVERIAAIAVVIEKQ